MPAKIRHLQPVVRLSHRLFASVQRLARQGGVSCSEIVEFILEEVFEGEQAAHPVDSPQPVPAMPSALKPRGYGVGPTVIPIERARRLRIPPDHSLGDDREAGDARALRQRSTDLRRRAQQAREHAAAACAAAEHAREHATRICGAGYG